MSVRIISIEGNIGSGKSALLGLLRQQYKDATDVIFVDEPLSVWESVCDEEGRSILEKFYADPKRYAFAFQILAYASRLKFIREATCQAHETSKKMGRSVTIFMERSLGCDSHVFAQMLLDSGDLSPIEHNIYMQYAAEGHTTVGGPSSASITPTTYIWVNTPPDTCMANVGRRNRLGEDSITLQYLTKCHECHVKWLGNACTNQGVVRLEGFGSVALDELRALPQPLSSPIFAAISGICPSL
jgi:deoxyadenosine/deoxycytidine kinase